MQKLPADAFRKKAMGAGFLSMQEATTLKRTEKNDGRAAHNQDLITIIQAEEKAGYIKLCRLIRDWGKFPDRFNQMNKLLLPADRLWAIYDEFGLMLRQINSL